MKTVKELVEERHACNQRWRGYYEFDKWIKENASVSEAEQLEWIKDKLKRVQTEKQILLDAGGKTTEKYNLIACDIAESEHQSRIKSFSLCVFIGLISLVVYLVLGIRCGYSMSSNRASIFMLPLFCCVCCMSSICGQRLPEISKKTCQLSGEKFTNGIVGYNIQEKITELEQDEIEFELLLSSLDGTYQPTPD